MSPYMQAYEAGIKLAQLEHMNKVAEGEESDLSSLLRLNLGDEDQMTSPPRYLYPMPEEAPAPETDFSLENIRQRLGEIGDSIGQGVGDAYQFTRDGMQAGQDLLSGGMDYLGRYMPEAEQPPAPETSFSLDDIKQRLGNIGDSIGQGLGGAYRFTRDGMQAGQDLLSGGMDYLGQFIPEAEQAGPPREFEMGEGGSLFEGPPRPVTFNAVQGGYGRQLAALRNQQGLSQADRDFLGDVDYRDMSRAMGNRALRQGDSFDANSLITRMRQQRSMGDQPGAMSGVNTTTPIQITNRRGRGVNRGTLPSFAPRQQGNFSPRNTVTVSGGLAGRQQIPAPGPNPNLRNPS